MKNRLCYFILVSWIFSACGDTTGPAPTTATATAATPADKKVALKRTTVKKEAIAAYSEKIPNPLNDWRFGVKLFETENTFRYLMKIEYEEMREQDTLKIPNLGFEPKIEIRKGDESQSCIIGFIDNKNVFREYKKVIAKNNNLKVTTLKHYAVYEKDVAQ